MEIGGHPECISLGIADPGIENSTREKILKLILVAREYKENQEKLLGEKFKCRKYLPPYLKIFEKVQHDWLNLDAKDISELVDLERSGSEYFTESPFLFKYSNEDLRNSVKFGISLDLPKVSVHSQSNEQAVQTAYKAAQNCRNPDQLVKKIIITNEQRELHPCSSNKDQELKHVI